jgi:hypothetical protein
MMDYEGQEGFVNYLSAGDRPKVIARTTDNKLYLCESYSLTEQGVLKSFKGQLLGDNLSPVQNAGLVEVNNFSTGICDFYVPKGDTSPPPPQLSQGEIAKIVDEDLATIPEVKVRMEKNGKLIFEDSRINHCLGKITNGKTCLIIFLPKPPEGVTATVKFKKFNPSYQTSAGLCLTAETLEFPAAPELEKYERVMMDAKGVDALKTYLTDNDHPQIIIRSSDNKFYRINDPILRQTSLEGINGIEVDKDTLDSISSTVSTHKIINISDFYVLPKEDEGENGGLIGITIDLGAGNDPLVLKPGSRIKIQGQNIEIVGLRPTGNNEYKLVLKENGREEESSEQGKMDYWQETFRHFIDANELEVIE